jgi:hypothetical protein
VWDRQLDADVIDLRARVTELEAQLNTALGILALIRPAETVLSRWGTAQEQQRAFYDLIDEMTRRVDDGSTVSYAEFAERVSEIVPARRGDRRFFEVLVEAVKLERPDSRPMLDHLTHAMALFRT